MVEAALRRRLRPNRCPVAGLHPKASPLVGARPLALSQDHADPPAGILPAAKGERGGFLEAAFRRFGLDLPAILPSLTTLANLPSGSAAPGRYMFWKPLEMDFELCRSLPKGKSNCLGGWGRSGSGCDVGRRRPRAKTTWPNDSTGYTAPAACRGNRFLSRYFLFLALFTPTVTLTTIPARPIVQQRKHVFPGVDSWITRPKRRFIR